MGVLDLFGNRSVSDTIVYFHTCSGARFHRGKCKPGSPTADFVLTYLVRKAVVIFTPSSFLAISFSRESARSVLSQGELQQRIT
jgi:hypothetical protein